MKILLLPWYKEYVYTLPLYQVDQTNNDHQSNLIHEKKGCTLPCQYDLEDGLIMILEIQTPSIFSRCNYVQALKTTTFSLPSIDKY
mgnify:CR=1 FL=1